MQSIPLFPLLTLLTFCHAAPYTSTSSYLRRQANETLDYCQNPLESGLNGTCYDILGVDAWVKNWNATTKTCQPDELWGNCFMREASTPAEPGLGCALISLDTCNEPTFDLVASEVDAQEIYTAFSIYALHELYTSIYNDIMGVNGSEYIDEAWSSMTAEITGKSLLGTLLYADSDPRTQFLALQVLSDVPVPGVDDSIISNQTAAPKVLGNILAAYLLDSMTNFTNGGYWGMANDGKLLV